jgi:hypothetical protein
MLGAAATRAAATPTVASIPVTTRAAAATGAVVSMSVTTRAAALTPVTTRAAAPTRAVPASDAGGAGDGGTVGHDAGADSAVSRGVDAAADAL